MPSLKIETITPAIATELLESNTTNRPLRKHRVAQYAADMKAGRWLVTGEPIITNGSSLINGQHRLQACIDAGVPFTTAVFRGANEDVYQVIDTGMGRTAGDVLRHAGISNYNLTAATARLVIGYEQDLLGRDTKLWAIAAGRIDILNEVQDHVDDYRFATELGLLAYREGYNSSSTAAFAVLLYRLIGSDDAGEWINGALTGIGLDAGDPRLALRRWVVGNRLHTKGAVHLSAWIRARNAFVKDESRTIIKSWFAGSPFPRLIELGPDDPAAYVAP